MGTLIMKIAGITWHGVDNFGSMLQAYALQKTIEKIGVKHTYISYTKKANVKYVLYYYYRYLRSMIPWLTERKDLFSRFHRKNIKATFRLFTQNTIHTTDEKYDGFICGSDQIWAPNVLDPTYMLDFVTDKTKKIAYAASIGLNDIPQELILTYKSNLSSFSAISVREEKGQTLLAEKCSVESQVVVDPTMLLKTEEWEKLEKQIHIDSSYVFCYFLSESNDYLSRNDIADSIGKSKVYGVTTQKKPNPLMINITEQVGPAEFLWLVDHAERVITDSFHGAVFSVIFNKKFTLCSRFDPKDPVCQNSRIEQLCKMLNIEKYRKLGTAFVDDESYYSAINAIVEEKRKEAMGFLSGAIKRLNGDEEM
jgi:hypothetical protein